MWKAYCIAYPHSSNSFFDETPKSYLMKMEAFNQRLRQREETSINNAYLNARLARVEKFPAYETLIKQFLPDDGGSKSELTEEQEAKILSARLADYGLKLKAMQLQGAKAKEDPV
ncbi:hypothetical protein [Pseudogemmobacter bohemicus]|uniref:hypothetical protein n=1 Tax=Pseudogemmobacter bohemicus TaxID=2250708 RepID=UPI001300A1FD|nr:hypothetical protein [Pseudogemmobacter bohemicus]